ncbi:MAG: biopolymer transporter ExbD [Myxococcota bacterium]
MAELTPAQRAYIRKRSKVHQPGPDELDDELNIVPFLDIVINLIMFLLMVTSSIAFYTQLEASLPTYSGGGVGSRAPQQQSLNLSVFVTTNGITVTGSSGKLQPGCETATTGDVVTVPMENGRYNWSALTDCVERVKRFADENNLDYLNNDGRGQITISADPLVQYQDVLWAMDAVRAKGTDELFPAVLLSAGVR